MARVNKNEEATKDKLWEIIKEEVDGQLSNESCLDSSFCSGVGESVADQVIDKIETLVEDLTSMDDEDADALPLLETIRSRYFYVLDSAEQRELERLLTVLRS